MTSMWVLCALFATTQAVDTAEKHRKAGLLLHMMQGASTEDILSLMDKVADSDDDTKKDFPMMPGIETTGTVDAERLAMMNQEAMNQRTAYNDAAESSSDAVQQLMTATGQQPYGQPEVPTSPYATFKPRPFLAQAQQDLQALQNIHAAPEHALDAAAAQSAKDLQAIEQPKIVPIDTTWVDHTAEDIAANRKKVHDVAEKIKAEFFGMKLPQPPASLMEVPPSGPGASLIQHSIAAAAAETAGDSAARTAAATRVLQEDSKHLQADFEKSFEKGMQEGFLAEKSKAEAAEKKVTDESAARSEEAQEQQQDEEKKDSVVEELEQQSEQSMRDH